MTHAMTDHITEWSCELWETKSGNDAGTHDSVTGLPNRLGLELMFREQLQASKKSSQGACAVMVDLDRFRMVNERWGLQAGERILATFGRMLPTLVNEAFNRPKITRVQGQAFVILCSEPLGESIIRAVEQLRQTMEATTFNMQPEEFFLTLSCGVVPMNMTSARTMIERLRKAVLTAKRAGRNRCCVEYGDARKIISPMRMSVPTRTVPVKPAVALV